MKYIDDTRSQDDYPSPDEICLTKRVVELDELGPIPELAARKEIAFDKALAVDEDLAVDRISIEELDG